MPILGKNTLKRYFRTGQNLGNAKWVDLFDSGMSKADTTAQTLNADFVVGQANVTGAVSAGEMNVDSFLASAAIMEGIVKHGTSAAASSQSTIGYPVVTQRATVATSATTQIANLQDASNITGIGILVLAASSANAGGTQINIGNDTVIDYFGTHTVSGVGSYKLTNVCASRLTNASGGVYAAGVTSSALASFLPWIEYYHHASAQTSTAGTGGGASLTLVRVTALPSAIGNFGTLSTLFNNDLGTSTSISSAK